MNTTKHAPALRLLEVDQSLGCAYVAGTHKVIARASALCGDIFAEMVYAANGYADAVRALQNLCDDLLSSRTCLADSVNERYEQARAVLAGNPLPPTLDPAAVAAAINAMHNWYFREEGRECAECIADKISEILPEPARAAFLQQCGVAP